MSTTEIEHFAFAPHVRFLSYCGAQWLYILGSLPGKQWRRHYKNLDIIEIPFNGRQTKRLRNILYVRLKHGRKPVVYWACGECYGGSHLSFGVDFSFSPAQPNKTNCWFYEAGYPRAITPPVWSSPWSHDHHPIPGWLDGNEFECLLNHRMNEHRQLQHWRNKEKTRFCNFIYSNPVKTRDEFCKQLMQYQPVACPGKCLNNMPRIPRYYDQQDLFVKLAFMSDFKFSICFENTSTDHYLTEKILHPFYAGSIPIYWGCPQVAQYYNPAAFVNCHDYDSFAAVIERVKAIDNDPALYRQYLEAPPILPSSRFYQMKEQLRLRAEEMVEEALRRRDEPDDWLKDALYIGKLLTQYGVFIAKHFVLYRVKRPIEQGILHIKQRLRKIRA